MVLLWTRAALGGAFGQVKPVALDGAWASADSGAGRPFSRWTDSETPPRRLQVAANAAPLPPGTVAVVQYESAAVQAHALPVLIERTILRIEAGPAGYRAVPLRDGEAFNTSALYLDQISLRSTNGSTSRFGLLEVALPPGATVETGTWGITRWRQAAGA
jgi:uncharacterized protein YfaS (alpha-2-macroglobulin family)